MQYYIKIFIITCYTKTGVDNRYFLLIITAIWIYLLNFIWIVQAKEDIVIDVFFSYTFMNFFAKMLSKHEKMLGVQNELFALQQLIFLQYSLVFLQ